MTAGGAGAHVRHLVVAGRVQGVGFRWFARERARRLALRGWVRNRDDGSVEVMVSGPSHAIAQFASDLSVGPPGADVTEVRDIQDRVADASLLEAGASPHDLPFPFAIQR